MTSKSRAAFMLFVCDICFSAGFDALIHFSSLFRSNTNPNHSYAELADGHTQRHVIQYCSVCMCVDW